MQPVELLVRNSYPDFRKEFRATQVLPWSVSNNATPSNRVVVEQASSAEERWYLQVEEDFRPRERVPEERM